MATEMRQVNGMTVMRYGIIGTDALIYSAWEPDTGHSTITRIDDQRVGRVGTRRLTSELDALPARSAERYSAVDSWHADQYTAAYAAIESAFPESAGGTHSMGEVTTHVTR